MYVWAFPPDWSQSFNVIHRYRTRILYSRDGKEQRIAERYEPRITLEFQCQATHDDYRRAQHELYRNLKDQIVVPFWPDRVLVGSIGNSFIELREHPPWMVPGAMLVIMADGMAEAHRISRIIEGEGIKVLALEDSLQNEYPRGSHVMPGYMGRLSADVDQRGLTSGVSIINVQFDVDPGTTQEYTPGPAGTVFDDKEIFEFPVNWADAVQMKITDPRRIVDFERGIREVFHPQDFLSITRTFSILCRDRDSIREFQDFFRRHRGMQREFYMPNPFVDFKAAGGLNFDSRVLMIEDASLAAILSGDTVHRAIAVKTTHGTFYNQIRNASISGVNTQLFLRNRWTQTIAMSEIIRVSILNIARFASDALTTEYRTDSIATLRPSVITLEDHWTDS